jgi:hypothetical protein
MHVFIDESGPFAGFHAGSISVVGALAVPHVKLDSLVKKYTKFRARLPQENGEVKGRLLDEKQIDKVIMLLVRNEALFEITALDLGMHTEPEVRAYKQKHGDEMLAKVASFQEAVRPEVEEASRQILKTPVNLYLQALVTFEVLHRLIGHTTAFFAQRKPYELGAFAWVVDGKDPAKVTKWEEWWAHYAQGALATMSKKRPSPKLPESFNLDYSFYDRFNTTGDNGEQGTDLKLLLKDIRFSAKAEPGLEFVDILTNAVRRTLVGNLQRQGWQNIHRLMVHRNETYISFVLFGEEKDVVRRAPYAKNVYEGFSSGGRLMLTRRNNELAAKENAVGEAFNERAGLAIAT